MSVIQSPGSLISYNIHRGNLVWEQGITIKQSDSYCHNLITISNVWIVPDVGKLGELTLDFGQYLIVIYSYHNQVSDISCDWASVQTEWGTKNKMRLDLNWLLSSVYRHTVVPCLVTQHWGRQGMLWSWQCPECHIRVLSVSVTIIMTDLLVVRDYCDQL